MFSTDKAEGNTQEKRAMDTKDCCVGIAPPREVTVEEHIDHQLSNLNHRIAHLIELKRSLDHRILSAPMTVINQLVHGI